MFVALDDGETHRAIRFGHLLETEITQLIVVALDETERLVRTVELEQPPAPSCSYSPGSPSAISLVISSRMSFSVSGYVALNISPLRAKPHRSEDGSRESMTTSTDRSEAEVCAGSHGPLDAA